MNKNFGMKMLPNSQNSTRPVNQRRAMSTEAEVRRLCETRATSRQLFHDLVIDHKNSDQYKLSQFVTHDVQQHIGMSKPKVQTLINKHRGTANPSVLGKD